MSKETNCPADGAAKFAQSVHRQLQSVPNFVGSRVTVALSGGADSVALCHFIRSVAEQYGITLQAAHLNHGLRGQESDADEQFVRTFCSQLGISLVVERLDWPENAHPGENELRRLRYAFLWRAAGEGFLLTAHTCTDSCETLLLHIARGSRLAGMRGIPARSGRLVRPLIDLTRKEIEAYCARNALQYQTDSSNLTDAYARNRIRHGVLPTLESVNPAAQKALRSWMQEAEELYGYLDTQVAALLQTAAVSQAVPNTDVTNGNPDALRQRQHLPGRVNTDASADPLAKNIVLTGPFRAEILRQASPVLLRYALMRLLSPYADCSAARIQAAQRVVCDGGALDWCSGVRLLCKNGMVRITDFSTENPPFSHEAEKAVSLVAAAGDWVLSGQIRVSIRQLERQTAVPLSAEEDTVTFSDSKTNIFLKINKKDLNKYLDYDTIIKYGQVQQGGEKLSPLLRFRLPGDFFCLNKGKGTKTLKKWLNEISYPAFLRAQLPLIALGSKVIWLADSGVAQEFAANANSKTIWAVEWTVTQNGEVLL